MNFISLYRAQVELGQVQQEIERRLNEKEEEFNNARKVHQKQAEQMQASIEAESKHKAEVLRTKKKLEADVQELEAALEHANNVAMEHNKTIHKYQVIAFFLNFQQMMFWIVWSVIEIDGDRHVLRDAICKKSYTYMSFIKTECSPSKG